jgi:hypothetical protein
MNCYGVPETILNVKEYGGPTTDSTTYKTFNYEKTNYINYYNINCTRAYLICQGFLPKKSP